MEAVYDPKPLTADQLRALSQEVKQALTELYDDRLDRVILYGSYARGDFHPESDVDFLVVLRDEVVKAGKEVRLMAPVIGLLSLKYEVEVSIFPTNSSHCLSGSTLFYKAALLEGVNV